MTYIDSLLLKLGLNLIIFIDYISAIRLKPENLNILDKHILVYVQFSSATINLSLILISFLIILNVTYNFFFKNFSHMLQILRIFNLFTLTAIASLFFIKFYYSLRLEQILGANLLDLKLKFFESNQTDPLLEYFVVFSSSFSDAIIILALITGIICLELLGLKNIFKNINNINIFFVFLIFVILMVSSNNILIMFICFEFLFLPTMYFVHKLGYSKKVDKANEILFY